MATPLLADNQAAGQPTDLERDILRDYGRGHELVDIAAVHEIPRTDIRQVLARWCGFDRDRAALAAVEPAPDVVEAVPPATPEPPAATAEPTAPARARGRRTPIRFVEPVAMPVPIPEPQPEPEPDVQELTPATTPDAPHPIAAMLSAADTFTEQMTAVQTTKPASGKQLDALKTAAIEAGRDIAAAGDPEPRPWDLPARRAMHPAPPTPKPAALADGDHVLEEWGALRCPTCRWIGIDGHPDNQLHQLTPVTIPVLAGTR